MKKLYSLFYLLSFTSLIFSQKLEKTLVLDTQGKGTSLVFGDPEDKILIATDSEGVLFYYDLEKDKITKTNIINGEIRTATNIKSGFAVGGKNGEIKIIKNNIITNLTGHTYHINSLASKGNILFSGSKDNTIQLWDVSKDANIGVFAKLESDIKSLSVSFDKKLAATSEDGEVVIWNIPTQEIIQRFSLLYAPQKIKFNHRANIIYLASESSIFVYEVDSGKKLKNYNFINNPIVNFAITKDDQFLLITYDNGTLVTVDLKLGKEVNLIDTKLKGIYDSAIDSENNFIALLGKKKEIKLFSLTDLNIKERVYPINENKANLILEHIEIIESSGNGIIEYGEKAIIKYKITNQGEGEIYDASINFKTQGLKGIKIEENKKIGHLKPNESYSGKLTISIKPEVVSQKGEITFYIKGINSKNEIKDKITIQTASSKGFNVVFIDSFKIFSPTDVISKNLPLKFEVFLSNIGEENIKSLTVIPGYPEGILGIKKLKESISIKKGGSESLIFEFIIQNDCPEPDLDISIGLEGLDYSNVDDKYLNITIGDEIVINEETDLKESETGIYELTKKTITIEKNIPKKNTKQKNRYALIIDTGDNKEYPHKTAFNNARLFKEYSLKTFGIEEENIIYLANASKNEIENAFERLTRMTKYSGKNTELVIYYSGNILVNTENDQINILPSDEEGEEGALELRRLFANLSSIEHNKIMAFFDVINPNQNYNFKNPYLYGNTFIFLSHSNGQNSSDYKNEYGNFTYHLLKEIQDKKGNISLGKLIENTIKNTALYTLKTKEKTQEPFAIFSDDIVKEWANWSID